MAKKRKPKPKTPTNGFTGTFQQLPDLDIEVNPHGGKQSNIGIRCDLLPPRAILAIAGVLKEGANKYDAFNWEKITVEENVNHAMTHLFNYLDQRRTYAITHAYNSEEVFEELTHAGCRILFAISQYGLLHLPEFGGEDVT